VYNISVNEVQSTHRESLLLQELGLLGQGKKMGDKSWQLGLIEWVHFLHSYIHVCILPILYVANPFSDPIKK